MPSITPNINPSTYGQAVSFTIEGTGGLENYAYVYCNEVQIAGMELIGDTAVYTTSTLPAGTNTIYVVTGNIGLNTWTQSGNITQTVYKLTTTTTLSANYSTTTYGQNPVFTATVTAGATGTVIFYYNNGATFWEGGAAGTWVALGTIALSGTTAVLNYSILPVGTWVVAANYQGDAGHDASGVGGSPGGSCTQVVNYIPTSVSISSSLNPSTYGSTAVTFTSNVTAGATGTISLYVNGTLWTTLGIVNNSVSASENTFGVGTNWPLYATYSGDATHAPATSGTIYQTVYGIPTTTTLTSGTNPTNYGSATLLKATVSTGASGAVYFYSGGGSTYLGAGTLNASNPNTATYSCSSLPAGTNSLVAIYQGDTTHATSTSGTVTQTVNKINSTLSLVSGTNPSTYTQSVLFTATATTGATGTVTFLSGSTSIGTAPLNASNPNIATLNYSTLAVGTHSITATYPGDGNYNSSSAGAVSQTVNSSPYPVVIDGNCTSGYGAASFTANIPSAVAGDVVVLFVWTSNGTTVSTAPPGFAQAIAQTTSYIGTLYVYSHVLSGPTDTSWTGALTSIYTPSCSWSIIYATGVNSKYPIAPQIGSIGSGATEDWVEYCTYGYQYLAFPAPFFVGSTKQLAVMASGYTTNSSGVWWTAANNWTQINSNSLITFSQTLDSATQISGSPTAVTLNPYNNYTNTFRAVSAGVVLNGTFDVPAEVEQFYVSSLYSTDARFRLTQQSIDVTALATSSALLTQQAVEVLHAYADVRYHTTYTTYFHAWTKQYSVQPAIFATLAPWHDATVGPVRATVPLIHYADNYNVFTYTRVHTTDRIIYKTWPLTHFATTGPVRATTPLIHTTDAYPARFILKYDNFLAYIHGANYRYYSVEASIRSTTPLIHYTDTLNSLTTALTYTTSTLYRATIEKVHHTIIYGAQEVILTHGTLFYLKALGEHIQHEANVYIFATVTRHHGTTTLLKSTVTTQHQLDAWATYVGILSHYEQPLVLWTTNLAHLAVPNIQGTYQHYHSTDATQEPFLFISHYADTLIRATAILAHTTSAIIMREVPVTTIPSTYKFTYKDDYGQIYTSIYKSTGAPPYDTLDITTIIEQPYVWGQNNAGYVSDHNLYRQGIITIQRMILQGVDGGYNILLDDLQPNHYQWVDNILTSFNCYDAPVDPFKYHLNANTVEEVKLPATVGPRFADVTDFGVVWGDVAADGTVSVTIADNVLVLPDGTIPGITIPIEYVDVWREDVSAITPWTIYMGHNTKAVLTQDDLATLVSIALLSDPLVTYETPAQNYKYICFPITFTTPTAFLDPNNLIGGQPANVVMADSSDNVAYKYSDGYNLYAQIPVQNTLGETMTYRVYRTKNQLGDPIMIQLV